MTLHALSLFSGIGLLDLGLHRAGIPTRLLCEADPAARRVLAHRFPDVPIQIQTTQEALRRRVKPVVEAALKAAGVE